VPNTVPPVVAGKFQSEKAKPKVVRAYDAKRGWLPIEPHPTLTIDAAIELREQGYTLVEARWRFRTLEFSISKLLASQ
jgi:hypothetical protein